MSKIAFLGLGAMGSRMAPRLIAAGHDLTVWNRSEGKTGALVELGAQAAETPRAAAMGADLVIAMLRDDGASASVWRDPETGALAGMIPGAVAIECSTITVGHARSLAKACETAGCAFLDAPLAGSRPQAEAGRLIFLVGGPAATLERARPALMAMGGAVHHLGDAGAGAAAKLMVNALFGVQLAAVAELIGFARRSGVDAARAVEALGETPVVSPAAKGAAQAMLARAFAPAFPIDLVSKDFGLVAQTAAEIGARLPVAEAAGAVYEQAAAQGFAADNITAVAQLYD